jgi:lipopolysaccharide export system protein LptA
MMKKHSLPALQLLALLSALLMCNVQAEKADSAKRIETLGDDGVIDQVRQQRTITGDVVLTQGSLVIKGAKLIAKTAADGTQTAVMYAPPNGVATIRQKRDGGPDLWMEGEAADRITYDQKTSVVTLISKAKVRRLIGALTTDECDAAYLAYNSLTEIVKGSNDASGISQPGKERIRCFSEARSVAEQDAAWTP